MSIFVPPGDSLLTLAAGEVEVEEILSEEIQTMIDGMFTIAVDQQIDNGNGVMVGLAAPQIGVLKRIILVDTNVDAVNIWRIGRTGP